MSEGKKIVQRMRKNMVTINNGSYCECWFSASMSNHFSLNSCNVTLDCGFAPLFLPKVVRH